MLGGFDADKLDLQKDYAEVLVKFCKVLRELRLDFNIGVFVTGVENLFKLNRLDNFVYLLRSCSLYFPNFLKIVLTVDKSHHPDSQIMRILQTQTVVEIKDQEVFQGEGRSYLEFALLYGAGIAEAEKNAQALENLEICISNCDSSYRRGIQMVHGLHKRGIHPRDQRAVKEFLQQHFVPEEALFTTLIGTSLAAAPAVTTDLLTALTQVKGPLHLETLLNIITHNNSEHSIDEYKRVLKQLAELLTY